MAAVTSCANAQFVSIRKRITGADLASSAKRGAGFPWGGA
jgi:hypothetical protein